MALVLVVEDDDDIRFTIVRILERAGHDAIAVSDGLAGLRALREHRPDLLVTDLDMPGLNGVQLCERAAAEGQLDDVPVLVVSGGLLPGDESLPRVPGAHALRKPFLRQDFLAAVDRALLATGATASPRAAT
ncbi:MAG TPA: response regulator [Pilimelia sp.]|nr:response regulator [Pilimelia sp.]